MRIGGVSVGKVKEIELAPPDKRVNGKDTTEAVLEIEPEFAPISTDARAILRQKTLLGETYVELTSGTKPGTQAAPGLAGRRGRTSPTPSRQDVKTIPEGGTLGVSRTEEATQIDEIFNALDKETRTSFQELAGERRHGDQRPRAGPQRLLRQPRAVRHRRLGHHRRARSPEGGAEGRRPRHGQGLPGADRAQSGARRRRSRAPTTPSTRSPPRTRPWPRPSRSCRPSSGSRARPWSGSTSSRSTRIR